MMYEYHDLSSSKRRSGQLATRHVERCDAGRVLSFHRYTRPKEWRSSSQRAAIKDLNADVFGQAVPIRPTATISFREAPLRLHPFQDVHAERSCDNVRPYRRMTNMQQCIV